MAEPKWIYADEEWINELQEKAKEVDYYRGYVKGLEYGYKAKEYDRASDCNGCKFVGVPQRCEGCCRNYADGYVAEQTEPTWEEVKEYCNKRCLDIVDSAMRKQWYKDEPQKWETPPKFEHKGVTTTCVSVPAFLLKDKPQTDCLTCRYNSDEWDSPKCDGCSKAHSNYEPQTDCAWK